ncbi:MAG: IS110 family transposase, partial [Microcoleus sp. SIO2G3]|nr:IS110 family transposase [Microcoleus sp. SIO2G3]
TPLGIDVGKHQLHLALLRPGRKPKLKVVANNAQGHQALLVWLNQQGCSSVHACLESTSTYGEAVAEVLHQAGHLVSIVNPARIKGFAQSELSRTKTDKADAALIARFCAAMQPGLWQPLPDEVKQLQALVRRLEVLKEIYQQESNRQETATAQVALLVEEHLDYLRADIKRTEELIKEHIERHPKLKEQSDLLKSIPGIGQTTAALIVGELGSVNRFDSAKQLAAYLGLSPQERSSGSSVRGRTQLSRTGSGRLRKAFYMPAVVAKRCNPLVSALCQRLAERGKQPMQIIGAAMRKLVHLVYGVLKHNCPFDPNFLSTP